MTPPLDKIAEALWRHADKAAARLDWLEAPPKDRARWTAAAKAVLATIGDDPAAKLRESNAQLKAELFSVYRDIEQMMSDRVNALYAAAREMTEDTRSQRHLNQRAEELGRAMGMVRSMRRAPRP